MHELADVIGHFLPPVQSSHKLPAYKLRALDALHKCRTPYMGGHLEACQDCGQVRVAHNSCRNRHCPKCGAIDKEKWVIAREADLLEVKYFHSLSRPSGWCSPCPISVSIRRTHIE